MRITSKHEVQSYTISSHPYLFDAFFRSLKWCGSGHVEPMEIYGGVNQAHANVDADEEGYRALKAAGFDIKSVSAQPGTISSIE
jgi:hypothetical protein